VGHASSVANQLTWLQKALEKFKPQGVSSYGWGCLKASCFWWTTVGACLDLAVGPLWMKVGTRSVVSGCSSNALVHESLSWLKMGSAVVLALWVFPLLHCYWCLCSTEASKSSDGSKLKTNCCIKCWVLYHPL